MSTVETGVSDSTTLTLEYDGPALTSNEMDVRDLAPALLSAANLFQQLNRQMNPTAPDVAVNVRATSQGSFLVDLRVIYEITKQATLSPDGLFTVALIDVLAGVVSLINFFKKRRQSPVLSESRTDEPGLVRVTFADNTTMEVPAAVLAASREVAVQRDLSEVVKPLNRDGVTSVRLSQDRVVLVSVDRSERDAFEPRTTDGQEVLSVTEREVFLTILTAGFESGRWRFSDGASSFSARIHDQGFVDRVNQGEPFSKLDVLRCSIRETQSRDNQGKLNATVEILKVVEHLPPAQQVLGLPEE